MPDLYPPESQNLDVIGHLEELRRRLLWAIGAVAVFSCISFSFGRTIIGFLKRPIEPIVHNLVFITPTEMFASYVKVSLLTGFIVSFPFVLYQLWLFLKPAISSTAQKNIVWWFLCSLVCFVSGIVFSYYVAIPSALKFLLNFGEGIAQPQLTINKYISFIGAFILIGGTIFEIPIITGLLTDVGIVTSDFLKKKRPAALLIIMIAAAVITPTQDIINMMIFALPMLLLFEIGIIVSVVIERKKGKIPKGTS